MNQNGTNIIFLIFYFFLIHNLLLFELQADRKMKSTGVPESKLTLNSAETNPANLKFITPYNNFDPSTQSQSNLIMKSTMSAPPPMTNNPSSSGISNHSTEANEPTGGGYVKASGEVATITVDLSKFNVALALDENNRFLEEWEKLLEKTGMFLFSYIMAKSYVKFVVYSIIITENTSIESLSKGVIQRHEYLVNEFLTIFGAIYIIIDTIALSHKHSPTYLLANCYTYNI